MNRASEVINKEDLTNPIIRSCAKIVKVCVYFSIGKVSYLNPANAKNLRFSIILFLLIRII